MEGLCSVSLIHSFYEVLVVSKFDSREKSQKNTSGSGERKGDATRCDALVSLGPNIPSRSGACIFPALIFH